MKRLLFLIAFLGTMGSLWAQATENLFEWQGGNRIIPNGKFLEKYKGIYTDYPTYIYKEYDISINKENSYILKMKGFDKTMSDLGTFDGFEIYHEGKKILDYLSYGHLFDVRYITEEKCRDYFIKVTLSNESFALFFGGWLLVVMKPLKWLLWLSLEIRQRWFLMIMLMLTNILPGSIFLLNMWMT